MRFNQFPIADLHCDLLCYLSNGPQRTPFDENCRCSIPQLKQGQVKYQTMAIYTPTEKGSAQSGEKQAVWFAKLLSNYSDYFKNYLDIKSEDSNYIAISLAIENGSSICEEDENLQNCFDRIEQIENTLSKVVYLSLTWNSKNRFGGGALTQQGITAEGIELLKYLDGRQIAVDISHSSDLLAYDILNVIDAQGLHIPVLASHSNARAVADVPRNLPDELIVEIIKREGLIGFNFVRQFVGKESVSNFKKQLDHFLLLGAEDYLCMGADFFYGLDVPLTYQKPPEDLFFPDYDHSGVYLRVLDLWRENSELSDSVVEKICYKNLLNYFEERIYLRKVCCNSTFG